MDDLQFRVVVDTAYGKDDVAGYDTLICGVPESLYIEMGGHKSLDVRKVGKALREMSDENAERLGEKLHSATFYLTTNPETVKTKGLLHDCPRCRAGMDQALAILEHNPEQELFVGQLLWLK